MSMTERVARLRRQSLEAVETISTERAELITEFYRQILMQAEDARYSSAMTTHTED